jgi:hypothetical protein
MWIMIYLDSRAGFADFLGEHENRKDLMRWLDLLYLPKAVNKLQKTWRNNHHPVPNRLNGCLLEGEAFRDDTLALILRAAIPIFASLVSEMSYLLSELQIQRSRVCD